MNSFERMTRVKRFQEPRRRMRNMGGTAESFRPMHGFVHGTSCVMGLLIYADAIHLPQGLLIGIGAANGLI